MDTVGRNQKVIQEYIKNQLQKDLLEDQMTMKEFIDPFTGEELNRRKNKYTALAVVGNVVRLADLSERL